MLLGPEDPGGEDAVEEGLDKSGFEEVIAFFAFKAEAESFFQRLADDGERREFVEADAGEGVASVGGEKPGDVGGVR